MKHRVGFNRLGRKTSHRKAMRRNMVTSLFKYERVTTTKAKALEIKRSAEKMITRAKTDSVHNRREVARAIWDKAIIAKLFTEIAPRFIKRPGGYTRVLKIGQRKGDAAELVILELVEKGGDEKKKDSKAKKAEAKSDKTPAKNGKTVKTEAKVEKPAVKETKKAEKKTEKPVKVDTPKVVEKAVESEKTEPEKTEKAEKTPE